MVRTGVGLSTFIPNPKLGHTIGSFIMSCMVPFEEPIHKYFQGPQNYNPVNFYLYYHIIRTLVDPFKEPFKEPSY